MKPSAFNYAKPSSVDEVLGLLSEHGDEATILAGGQSLMPTMNMRLSAPSLVIDINGLVDLSGISSDGDSLRIGALTRHVEIENSPEIAKHAPLIAMAMPSIAHPAIRNRGTMGGSVAMADPAAELPACLCALGAEIEITGSGGARKVAATDFFRGLYDTDLGDGEILTAIEIPKISAGYRSAFDELARRHGDYAMCGVAAHAKVDGGTISDLRLVFFAVGGTPVAAASASAAMEGQSVDDNSIAAAQAALEEDISPFDDLHCSATLRMHYAKELTKHVLTTLAAG
jgi:carbon-monoxide dehydrogenase medium subunit|tara:strand:- start:3430 stop:4287 length:858 start_codon:yes stop_codon:yes gene_type:complete